MNAADLGTSLATLVVAFAAFVQSWRGQRASRRSADAAEPVRDVVAPDSGPTVTARLERMEREQHDIRRAVDRVENDLSTHLQLHSFMGAMRQRWGRHDQAGETRAPDPAADPSQDGP